MSHKALLAAKDKMSIAAAAWYGEHLPRGLLYAEFTGLQLEHMPDLLEPFWLQSLALSFNRLRSWSPGAIPRLRTLSLASNLLESLPEDLHITTPQLEARPLWHSVAFSCMIMA